MKTYLGTRLPDDLGNLDTASGTIVLVVNRFADPIDSANLTEPPTKLRHVCAEPIRATPNLDWLVLTKRIENAEWIFPPETGYWPNVWLGTSTENQEYADKRIPELLKFRDRFPVLFLSVEPILGPVDLCEWLGDIDYTIPASSSFGPTELTGQGVDWVIVGGESGPRHRPFDVEWVRTLRDECRDHEVAFFFKQHGGRTHAEGGCELDGVEIKEFPTVRLPLAA